MTRSRRTRKIKKLFKNVFVCRDAFVLTIRVDPEIVDYAHKVIEREAALIDPRQLLARRHAERDQRDDSKSTH
jgi:hypothetical protein